MDIFDAKLRDLPQVELGKRFFTVEQANRSLVLVRKIIADVLEGYQKVLDQQEILEDHQLSGRLDQVRSTQQKILFLVEKLQGYSDELVEIGAEMKDWSTGLVDFPALRSGLEVQLCWRYGEDEIHFWHEIDDGCAGRRSLETF